MDFVLDSVDNLDIINEIEARPCIWDNASPDYSDRGKKHKAWSEVALIFHPTLDLFDTFARNEIVRHLQRRWKSLRDSYSRELSRGKRRRPNERRKVYVYFKRLAFLSDVVKAGLRSGVKIESVDEEDDAAEDTEYSGDSNLNYIIPDKHTSYPVAVEPEVKRRKIASSPILGKPVPTSSAVPVTTSETSLSNGSVPDAEDFDRMFLLSLLHDLKKIPDHKRLSVKGEIMRVIQDAQEQGGMLS